MMIYSKTQLIELIAIFIFGVTFSLSFLYLILKKFK